MTGLDGWVHIGEVASACGVLGPLDPALLHRAVQVWQQQDTRGRHLADLDLPIEFGNLLVGVHDGRWAVEARLSKGAGINRCQIRLQRVEDGRSSAEMAPSAGRPMTPAVALISGRHGYRSRVTFPVTGRRLCRLAGNLAVWVVDGGGFSA
jgi:hypothetical protein